jgi:hypothetical protein
VGRETKHEPRSIERKARRQAAGCGRGPHLQQAGKPEYSQGSSSRSSQNI